MKLQDWIDHPDAWLYIPKFGVKPSEVNFDGFRNPVFTHKVDFDFAENIALSIGIARKLAQKEFGGIDELRSSFIEALDELEDQDAILGERHRTAVLYNFFIHDLERVTDLRTSPKKKLEAMASAATSLASWAVDGSEAAIKRFSQAQTKRRMGKTKLSDSDKRRVVREYEAAVTKYGALKSLARKFDVSDDTIRRILHSNTIKAGVKLD